MPDAFFFSGCVEFAAIDEKEELSNEKSPLINRINANGAAVKSESPTPTNGISWYSVAFGLANASIGVGILNYPFIYDRVGGIQLATFIQIVSWSLIVNDKSQIATFPRRLSSSS